MNENLKERFEQLEKHEKDFKLMKSPIHPNRYISAILKGYELTKPEYKTKWYPCADHEVIYISSIDDLVELNDNDIIELLNYGVFVNDDNGCLAIYT